VVAILRQCATADPRRALLVASAVAFACGANGAGGGDASVDGGASGDPVHRREHRLQRLSHVALHRGSRRISLPAIATSTGRVTSSSTTFPTREPCLPRRDDDREGDGPWPAHAAHRLRVREARWWLRTRPATSNWEWFSLQNLANGTESILWRGPGPASGGVYGNGALGGCNSCHGAVKSTDYVFTPQLEAMIAPPDAATATE